MRVAVIGAGSWGTAIAALVSANAETTLWSRRPELAQAMATSRRNARYLPDLELGPNVAPTADIGEAVAGTEVVIMSVPSHGYREVLAQAAPHIAPDAPIVSLAKGIEQGTLKRMTEITAETLPEHPPGSLGVLSGPNLAGEVIAGQPTATVVAFSDPQVAQRLQTLLMSPTFRVYTNLDVVGVETAGALKNVMAIAAGMASGLGFGDNTMATLVTRALAELSRLGVALGGKPATFAGLAGMGDLIATCMSAQSRNRRVGYRLGTGQTIDQVLSDMKSVAEGVKTTQAVLDLGTAHEVEMPIAEQVGLVLYEDASPRDAVLTLMTREAKDELD